MIIRDKQTSAIIKGIRNKQTYVIIKNIRNKQTYVIIKNISDKQTYVIIKNIYAIMSEHLRSSAAQNSYISTHSPGGANSQ